MKPASQRPKPAPAAPGFVRIIGGDWKRSKLPVPAKPGLRPTPDRVRETLFNWLGQSLLGWRCVDPFAGTGAVGLRLPHAARPMCRCVNSTPLWWRSSALK